MKRIITLSLLSMALFFTQCKKSSQTEEAASPVIEAKVEATADNTLAIESVKSLPSQDLKRLAFGALKPVERYLLWIDNIKTVSAKFTPKQKSVVFELAVALKPSLFVEPGNAESKTIRDSWLPKAEAVLTAEQIRALIYEIGSSEPTVLAVNNTDLKVNLEEEPPIPNCNCNGGAQFTCDSRTFCPTDFSRQECKNPSSWGCGFSGLWECNNACYAPPVPPAQD
jgi:hypothetical protein